MIDILLATYNGEKYIKALLHSIEEQTYKNINLIIRDDSSKDNTLNIIKEFQTKSSLNIQIIQDNKGNLGSTRCFEELIKHSTSDYCMFCDQDDVCLPQKVNQTYLKIKELESTNPQKPVLVFTDLYVVNENLQIIADSFFNLQKLYPDVCHNPWKCMALSVAPGCTMLLNKECKKFILPIPSFLVHDHWIITNIAYYGKCDYIPWGTILYRQHSNNCIGAHPTRKYDAFLKLKAYSTLIPHYIKEFKSYHFKVKYLYVIFYKIAFFIKRFFL